MLDTGAAGVAVTLPAGTLSGVHRTTTCSVKRHVFDEDGLWFYRTVGFSSYGNLTRTVVGLVDHSPVGLTPNELATLLHVRVQNQLFYLSVQEELDRIALGRGYVYLSVDDHASGNSAGDARRTGERGSRCRGEAPLTDAETIAILAELVRARSSSARGVINKTT